MKTAWHWFEKIAHWIGFLAAVAAIAAVVVIVERPSEKSGNQPNFVGAEQQQKRLAIVLDGTWNSVDSNTNVWRLRALATCSTSTGSLTSRFGKTNSGRQACISGKSGGITVSTTARTLYHRA